ncbi:MAG: hypothetical protein HYU77_01735 [Betaproteobacteria bacterium]|nr:hypothetical protein [Betaproteobacteria bacterium]
MIFSVEELEAPGFRARDIKAVLAATGNEQLRVNLGELTLQGRTWRKLGLICRKAELDRDVLRCRQGVLELPEKIPVRFDYAIGTKTLEVEIAPEPGERWRLRVRLGETPWSLLLTADNGQATRLAAFMPENYPRPSAGRVRGSVSASGSGEGLRNLMVELVVAGLAFSDAAGLRAGENVDGRVSLRAERDKAAWGWQGEAVWIAGDVFWQPFFGRGAAHRVAARGTLDSRRLAVATGVAAIPDVGEVRLSGTLARPANDLEDFELHAQDVNLGGLQRQVLKPLLDQTAYSELSLKGRMTLDWHYRGGRNEALQLTLKDADVEDGRGRFALRGLRGDIPWSATRESRGEIRFASGALFGIGLGEIRVPLRMNGSRVTVSRVRLPVLDGRFTVEGFDAEMRDGKWRWQLNGGIGGVSMEKLTAALGITTMHGKVTGVIPRVSYEASTLAVDGALLFQVFDGSVVAKNLVIVEPFGRAPRLSADVEMRSLDLELLTRAFSFGNIQGRIDVDVAGLVLSKWIPVRFDARVMSTPGDYPRKISQTAVQNISALGGAGAAAAIQRSFLRFFDQFSYSKIGLSCVLRNGVCRMGGADDIPRTTALAEPSGAGAGERGRLGESDSTAYVSPAATHGYVIVKGGGIPAITVMGYNRSVSWDELLSRLQRITRDNLTFEMR